MMAQGSYYKALKIVADILSVAAIGLFFVGAPLIGNYYDIHYELYDGLSPAVKLGLVDFAPCLLGMGWLCYRFTKRYPKSFPLSTENKVRIVIFTALFVILSLSLGR